MKYRIGEVVIIAGVVRERTERADSKEKDSSEVIYKLEVIGGEVMWRNVILKEEDISAVEDRIINAKGGCCGKGN